MTVHYPHIIRHTAHYVIRLIYLFLSDYFKNQNVCVFGGENTDVIKIGF